jgi:capsular exopolysaccharide synthesis family protein
MTPHNDTSDEIDLRRLWSSLRKYTWPILGVTALSGLGSYLLFRSQPPTYEATSTILAARSETGNSTVNNSLVAAPPLPTGAVEEAIHGTVLVEDIINRLKSSGLPTTEISFIAKDLRRELANDSASRIKVTSKLDSYFLVGVHTLRANAGTPEAAQILTNAAADSLLAWDVGRARAGVRQARQTYEKQLAALNNRIRVTAQNSLDRETLLSGRARIIEQLSTVVVLEQAATGTLSLISRAVTPLSPTAPRPLRNSVLVAFLALFLGSGAALVRETLGRKISSGEDVASLGLPVLGNLPKLNTRQLALGIPQAVRSGALFESVGFLRVNLMSSTRPGLEGQVQRRYVISSARPGEGKSSVTASLAIGLANSGLRVLIVDADLHRPSQMRIWSQGAGVKRQYRPLVGATSNVTPALDLPGALERPEAAHAVVVAERIDLLPAGSPLHETAHILTHPQLEYLMDRWSSDYDVVLIDSPPILALADSFSLASLSSGMLMVVEANQTQLSVLERALSAAQVANAQVLGLVLNKVSRRSEGYYYYNGYSQTGTRPSDSPQKSKDAIS